MKDICYVKAYNSYVEVGVKRVKYFTGGMYKYTFKILDTLAKYYLEFDSNRTTLDLDGSISNYVYIK